VVVYIEPSQYTASLNLLGTVCTYNFGTLSSVGSILLLGDIFFQGYIITFDKPNSRVGFKGNLGQVQNVFLGGSVMFGYIWMGVIGLAILIGLFGFCLLDKDVPQPYAIDITDLKQIEFSVTPTQSYTRYKPSNRLQQPSNRLQQPTYRLQQPML
jgi:hypothetical protein